MCGDNLGRRQSRQSWNISECDLDLLSKGLGEDGVPGDGGGDEGVGGDQTSKVGQLSDPSDTSGERLGGEDEVCPGGEAVGLQQGGECLLGSEEKSDDAGLHQWLCPVDRGALSDHLLS